MNYTLVVRAVLKSPPWLFHVNEWLFLLHGFFVCFPNTIEEIAPESSSILSEWNLALPILMFVFPYNKGV